MVSVFSALVAGMERRGNAHVLRKIFGMLTDEEYEEIKRSIEEIKEEFRKWKLFLTL